MGKNTDNKLKETLDTIECRYKEISNWKGIIKKRKYLKNNRESLHRIYILGLKEDAVDLYYKCANIYYNKKEYQKALNCLNTALELSPTKKLKDNERAFTLYTIFLKRASVYKELKLYANALEDLFTIKGYAYMNFTSKTKVYIEDKMKESRELELKTNNRSLRTR